MPITQSMGTGLMSLALSRSLARMVVIHGFVHVAKDEICRHGSVTGFSATPSPHFSKISIYESHLLRARISMVVTRLDTVVDCIRAPTSR